MKKAKVIKKSVCATCLSKIVVYDMGTSREVWQHDLGRGWHAPVGHEATPITVGGEPVINRKLGQALANATMTRVAQMQEAGKHDHTDRLRATVYALELVGLASSKNVVIGR